MSTTNAATALQADRSGPRELILEAAIDVFSAAGYQGFRLADVAKRAGFGYGLVYYYFKSKDDLLQALFEERFRWFYERLERATQAGGSINDIVTRVIRCTFDSYVEDPRAMSVLLLTGARSPAIKGGATQMEFMRIIAMAAQLFGAAIETGEISSKLNPTLLAMQLYGAVELGLLSIIAGLCDGVTTRDAADQIAACFLAGVATGAPAAAAA